MGQQMTFARTYAGPDGESHIELVDIAVAPVNFFAGNPTVYRSSTLDAQGVTFFRLPPHWAAELHPTPHRHFLVVCSGECEVETSDGRTCVVRPGSFALLEDTSGKGHISRVRGVAECWGMSVTLPA